MFYDKLSLFVTDNNKDIHKPIFKIMLNFLNEEYKVLLGMGWCTGIVVMTTREEDVCLCLVTRAGDNSGKNTTPLSDAAFKIQTKNVMVEYIGKWC